MKLKALANIIKKARVVTLYDDSDNLEQWVRAGGGIYLLSRLPWFDDVEQLLTILDISEKDQEKLAINHTPLPSDFSFKDGDAKERQLLGSALELTFGGYDFIPARTSMGLRFFDKQYLGPLRDLGDDYILAERLTSKSEPYIAVKQGLCIRGIIVPETLEKTRMASELQQLHEEMMVTMSYLATHGNKNPSPN